MKCLLNQQQTYESREKEKRLFSQHTLQNYNLQRPNEKREETYNL